MKQSESIAALAAALAKAQGAIPPARKDSLNPHFKSHYADLTAIWEACRPALAANGLSVVQFPCDGESDRIGLTSILMHSSGEWMTGTVTVPALKQDPQFLGGVLTYLRRYSLAAIVGVTATEDDDANSVSLPSASQTAKPPYRAPERAAAPTAPVEKVAMPAQDGARITGVHSNEGVGKNGKSYLRYRIEWTIDGESRTGTTFKDQLAELAREMQENGRACVVEATQSKFGLDIVSLDYARSSKEAVDEIPF